MPRLSFQPSGLFQSAPWGFSQVVISEPGRMVHISGQVAWNELGQIGAHDLEGQFRQTLNNVVVAVTAAGGTADDIQALRLYIPNFQAGVDTEVISRVLVEVFGTDNLPASSWIGVQSLAQVEYLIEVEATAVVPLATLPSR